MNNNHHDLAALQASCKGVFSSTGYLNVGTKEKPLEYVQKQPERDGFKGKQFLTNPPKLGRTLDTFFGMGGDKKLLYIAEGLPYVDREKFQDTQPNKPGKGFLTSDYSRRGEFTNTIRTEQYRTQLKQEEKIAKKQQAQLGQGDDILLAAIQSKEPEGFLYDRVFDTTPARANAHKLARDTSNPVMLTNERQQGLYHTSYLLAHAAPTQESLHRPEHARTAVVRDTFFDKDMSSSLSAA